MASKQEYEDVINKILGTSIKWSLLTKEDLVSFTTLLSKPEVFLEKLNIKEEKKQPIRGILQEVITNNIGEGKMLKKMQDLLLNEKI